MEYLIVVIGCLIVITVLALVFEFSIKKIKEEANNEKLNKIANKFPENEEICKAMLKMLNNEKVNIKQNENSKDKTSLYVAISDTIFIADIKDMYTRIQTIAHECLHSIQNRKMLMFNFIYTTIYAIYFITSVILTLVGVFKHYNLQIIILLLMGILQYVVRSYLETDAMTKARFLAEDYMKKYVKENNRENKIEKNRDLITIQEVDEIVINYDKINELGVPAYNFILIRNIILKIIIYTVIALIKSI